MFVTETTLATVWRVTCVDGRAAALKLYKDGMADEAPGLALMRHWSGHGAAEIYHITDRAILLAWLDGPALSHLVHIGDDDAASKVLVAVARRLHAAPAPKQPLALPSLHDRFTALFQVRTTRDCPAFVVETLAQAQRIACDLLASSDIAQPLHGDLHHDNIMRGADGWQAIDAKGVLGDPLYDLANAFRNPVGANAVFEDPARIMGRAALWAQEMDTSPQQLLRWAAAHGALSAAWAEDGHLTTASSEAFRQVQRYFRLIGELA